MSLRKSVKQIIESDKGIDVYDVASQVKDTVDEMLNKHFEAVDGTLKSDIEITIKIEVSE
jgi:hypothetical protein